MRIILRIEFLAAHYLSFNNKKFFFLYLSILKNSSIIFACLLQDTTVNEALLCAHFSAPILSRTVCYFYHCPSFYFPCVFQIHLPLTGSSKKLRMEAAELMKRRLPALRLPVEGCAAPAHTPAVTATAVQSAYWTPHFCFSSFSKSENWKFIQRFCSRVFIPTLCYCVIPKFCRPKDLVNTLWHAIEK